MTVHVPGAAGWIPGVNETSCIMVENKGSLFILDAWDGISADLLFHECWEYRTSGHDRHTSLQQLKSQLSLSDFGEIYLIHHNPEWSDEDFKKIREMTEKTKIALAEDGMEISI